jgi:tetratricopeptide (TPR) repeat protein
MNNDSQTSASPYVGPRPFERRHRTTFFGRSREVRDLLSMVTINRISLLYAPSGAGKTSLLNAGLIPLLEQEGFAVMPVARVRGVVPSQIDPETIPNIFVFNALTNWAGDEVDPLELVGVSLADVFREPITRRDETMGGEEVAVPRVVIFDQFEELFTFHTERWSDRAGFFEELSAALDVAPMLRIILAIREEFVAQLDPYRHLVPGGMQAGFRLERLRDDPALRAIKRPVEQTWRRYEEGVAEVLVDELRKTRAMTDSGQSLVVSGEYVEPVQLQVICESLWRSLPPHDEVITFEHLRALGGVSQALSNFYEDALHKTAQQTGVSEADLRAWFGEYLITPSDTRGTVYRGKQHTGNIPNEAVDVLENLHIVRGQRRAGARWYELTHDRFIEPIRRSNEAWVEARRERQARRLRTLLVALGLTLVALAIGFVVYTQFIRTQVVQMAQAAAAGEIAAAAGQAEVAMAQAQQAEQAATQAVAQASVAEERAQEAEANQQAALIEQQQALYESGLLYLSQGDYELAASRFEDALAIQQQLGDQAKQAQTLTSLAKAYSKLERYQDAAATLMQVLAIQRELGDRSGEMSTLTDLGGVYQALGQTNQALDTLRQALDLQQTLDDQIGQAETLTQIGLLLHETGDEEAALNALSQALAIQQEIDDQLGEAQTLTQLATVYQAQGQSNLAIEMLQEALAIQEEIGDQPGQAATLVQLGQVYQSQGNNQQALDNYEQVLTIQETANDLQGQADTLNLILAIEQDIGSLSGQSQTLTRLGLVYSELGELETARDVLTQALAIQQTIGDIVSQIQTQDALEGVDRTIQCPGALEARLEVGGTGRVTLGSGLAQRVRVSPGRSSEVLTTLPEGTAFTVLEGPACVDGWLWWRVQTVDGVVGWVSEGDPNDGYYLEPYELEQLQRAPEGLTPTATPTETSR